MWLQLRFCDVIFHFVFFLPQMVTRTKKVFVGGLSAPTTLDDVKNYFQQFGKVSSVFTFWRNYLIVFTSHAANKLMLFSHVRLVKGKFQ